MSAQDRTAAAFDLELNDEDMQWISEHFRANPVDMLQSPTVSAYTAVNRLLRIDEKDFRTLEDIDPAVVADTIEYNRQELMKHGALHRPRLIVDALRSIHYIHLLRNDLKVLSVGPRSEHELLMLLAAGFQPPNVRGLDLISYSDLVDLGDMHAMPYADDSFDVIILGWVLGYSHDCRKVADEVIRVARPGAYVAIGCERPAPKAATAAAAPAAPSDHPVFSKTEEYVELFEGHVHAVPIRHEVHRRMQDIPCHVIAVLELK